MEMDSLTAQRWAFTAEWSDPASSCFYNFYFYFYPANEEVELIDVKKRKPFLKKVKCPGICKDDFYVGSKVHVFSRLILITGYANEYTKKIMDTTMQRTFGIVTPEGMNFKTQIIKAILQRKIKIANIKTTLISRSDIKKIWNNEADCPDEYFQEQKSLVVAIMLVGTNVAKQWSDLAGFTECSLENTLRRLYGNNVLVVPSNNHIIEQGLELFFPIKKRNGFPYEPTAFFQNSSLCVVKPHVIKLGQLGDIIEEFESRKLSVTAMSMCTLTMEEVTKFLEAYEDVYAENYQAIIRDMSSGALVALEITGEVGKDTVAELRRAVGPYDPDIARFARPWTMRAQFGIKRALNAFHVTDLPEDAELELSFFFQRLITDRSERNEWAGKQASATSKQSE